MTLNGVMAITLRYFTKFGKPALQKKIRGGIYARVYCIFSACRMSSLRKFTFAISSPDEFPVYYEMSTARSRNLITWFMLNRKRQHSTQLSLIHCQTLAGTCCTMFADQQETPGATLSALGISLRKYQVTPHIFTALHEMPTRSSDAVCLSVRLSNVWIVTKRKKNQSRFLDHMKDHLS